MTRDLTPYESAIAKAQDDFTRSAEGLDFHREKIFALQQLRKTDFATQVANKNPLSVRLSMLNLAATGLTLNPAHGYAFLVPRDGAIVLEISYRGLLKIATDTGAIVWGRAEVVHELDVFVYHGPAREPEHVAQAFRERGDIIGVYCIAKTPEGDILTEIMDRAAIETIRAKSDLYARKKSGPWVEFFSEMARKAVIKRAQKTWPRSSPRLAAAIELANATEGGYTLDAEPVACVRQVEADTLAEMIAAHDVNASEFLALFGVETVEALPAFRYAEALAYLRGRIAHTRGLAHENP